MYKLHGKVVLITAGNTGIGRATSFALLKEGATVFVAYHSDSGKTDLTQMEKEGQSYTGYLLGSQLGNIQYDASCKNIIDQVVGKFGKIDVLIHNVAEQHPTDNFLDISREQLETTFKTNVFGPFRLTQFALPYMKKGSSIIFTTSVTAYKGHGGLIDYAATKGALVSLTRALAANLAGSGIRVNAIAPGPVWTPLVQKTFPDLKKEDFGTDTPLGRCAEPEEIAPYYVLLASDESSYMTGQCLHPNGGESVGG